MSEQVENPEAASALLRTYGSVRFKFIDMSGCRAEHSVKDRADIQVSEETGKDSSGLNISRRGHTKIVESREDGTSAIVGWAKRADKPLFEEAERILKGALGECRGLIQRCSVKVGGARAVPATRYADFALAKERCREITLATNQDLAIIEANKRLSDEGKNKIRMEFFPSLFPELSLSDPEDLERAERIRNSVAESIGQVVSACKSGDRDKIKYVLEQVGALGDAVSDPKIAGDVQGLLSLAQQTAEAITVQGRAQSAALRANPETSRGQAAAERFLQASAAAEALQAKLASAAETVSGFFFEGLETSETSEAAPVAASDLDLGVELTTPQIAKAPEDLIAEIASEVPASADSGLDLGIEV